MKTYKLNPRHQSFKIALNSVFTATMLAGALAGKADPPDQGVGRQFDAHLRARVNHIVVIYQENWSFDMLYGQFPGVNGLQNGFNTLPQLDKASGYANYIYVTPQALNGGLPDLRFPPANGQRALPLAVQAHIHT